MLVNIIIDGKEYEVKSEETILSICLKLGIFVPHLCFLKNHVPLGRCRMCVVETENNTLSLGCMTYPRDGMVIKTNSEIVLKSRKETLKKILEHHTITCLNCHKSGSCKLQVYSSKIYDSNELLNLNLDQKNIMKDEFKSIGTNIHFNISKCIFCGRCTSLLNKICQINIKNIEKAELHDDFNDLSCNIIDVCPTAALKDDHLEYYQTNPTLISQTSHDYENIYARKFEISKFNDKIVKISSVDGKWIRNSIRQYPTLIEHDRSLIDKNNNLFYEYVDKIVDTIKSRSKNIKAFFLGDFLDIQTILYIDYLVSKINNGVIVVDNHNTPQDIIKTSGLPSIISMKKIEYAIILGAEKISDIIYLIDNMTNLKKYENIKDMTNFSINQNEFISPSIFVYTNVFENISRETLNNFIENIQKFCKNKVEIFYIPRNTTELYLKYIKNFIYIDEFTQNHNKHDVDFLYVAENTNYDKFDTNEMDIIYHGYRKPANNIQNLTFIQSKSPLENAGYFMNIYNKFYNIQNIIESETKSSRDFIIEIFKRIFNDNYNIILKDIHNSIRDILSNN